MMLRLDALHCACAAAAGRPLLTHGACLLRAPPLLCSVLVAACLWAGMVLGELQLVSQPVFAALAYTAALTLPAAYVRSRWVGQRACSGSDRRMQRASCQALCVGCARRHAHACMLHPCTVDHWAQNHQAT